MEEGAYDWVGAGRLQFNPVRQHAPIEPDHVADSDAWNLPLPAPTLDRIFRYLQQFREFRHIQRFGSFPAAF